MRHKMSVGSLVLNISDLDYKCLECVFVKIMEILVSDGQACGIGLSRTPLAS